MSLFERIAIVEFLIFVVEKQVNNHNVIALSIHQINRFIGKLKIPRKRYLEPGCGERELVQIFGGQFGKG